MNLLKYEKYYWNRGIKLIAGIDEAGRGPLAGPVVAASVIIDNEFDLTDINDSKKLSPKKREKLYHKIIQNAIDVSIGIAHEYEIDKLNILNATFLAMKRAVGNMKKRPEQLLIDGPHTDIKLIPVKNIISGDSKSASIAAASIIAKVTRDSIMKEYDKIYTRYNFKQHKGYGTKMHIENLIEYKASPIHRKSFKIVKSNMPTISYYIENNLFTEVGSNYIGANYIRNQYSVINKNIQLEQLDDVVDYLLIKNDEHLFLKIITLYNGEKFSLGNIAISEIEQYLIHLEDYLIKKELKKDFIFNVISIEFIKNKKPIINIIHSDIAH